MSVDIDYNDCLFQGYFYKKSYGLNKEWKKKYVIFLDDGRLIYYLSLYVSVQRLICIIKVRFGYCIVILLSFL